MGPPPSFMMSRGSAIAGSIIPEDSAHPSPSKISGEPMSPSNNAGNQSGVMSGPTSGGEINSPSSNPLSAISALMQQNNNISIVESNKTPRYDCHAGRGGRCNHSHSYRGPAQNRHMCKDCEEDNKMNTAFKALAPKFPGHF